jgi:hypothetical protein
MGSSMGGMGSGGMDMGSGGAAGRLAALSGLQAALAQPSPSLLGMGGVGGGLCSLLLLWHLL